MPTLSGLRRRGFTAYSIRDFAERIGVAKSDNTVEVEFLEHCLREDLNKRASRVMGVLNPIKVIINNYPKNQVEELDAINNPEDENAGTRKVPFSKTLYIERDDFMEDPPKKFFRMGPGREVRLKGAYIVKCEDYVKDDSGNITEIRCTYDPETKSGGSGASRKVKGTLHWVSTSHAIDAEIRLYDRLFMDEDPAGHKDKDFKEFLNPDSLKILRDGKLEPSLKTAKSGDKFQFQRLGYFCVDPDSAESKLVFNRTVPLRDSWAKKNR
jgi:glutaminyl-tRNA synthetase